MKSGDGGKIYLPLKCAEQPTSEKKGWWQHKRLSANVSARKSEMFKLLLQMPNETEPFQSCEVNIASYALVVELHTQRRYDFGRREESMAASNR